MEITKITVAAQRKVPHPSLDYGNLSALVSVEAVLTPDDSPEAAVKQLQARAEELIEQHLDKIVARLSIRQRAEISSTKAQAATADKATALALKHGNKQ